MADYRKIGFIGAGTIIFQKHVVKGLTTAAGIWVVAAIGMACGSGLYIISAATFPSYFLKDEAKVIEGHARLDLEIFKKIGERM